MQKLRALMLRDAHKRNNKRRKLKLPLRRRKLLHLQQLPHKKMFKIRKKETNFLHQLKQSFLKKNKTLERKS